MDKLVKFLCSKSHLFVAATILVGNTVSYAQNAGDEDKEMFNHAKARDDKAIKEAREGWWTESMKTHNQRIQWWKDAKFGMFVHWGIYSLPGGEWKGKEVTGYAEHLMRKEKISRAEYLELANRFNPVKFNADEWILAAKRAGMNYFVITAKHHDGFAMYDSKVSDFDIVDKTPFKRDPMAELTAAAKRHGMRFGFYYSHAFDWEHPDAPGNDWEFQNPGGDKLLGGANWFDTHPEWLPKAVKYVDNKAIPQIKELIQRYHPDMLWFDTPHKLPFSENLRILKAIREADPNIVVNGRLARTAGMNFGDYNNTGDRPAEFRSPSPTYWEAVPTTNESYGYSKYDSTHKSGTFFIQLLAKAASRGGNILANLGPMGDGSFDPKDVRIFDSVGLWIDKHKTSIFGTERTPLAIPSWGVTTQAGNKLYLHVFNWPKSGKLVVGGLKSNVAKAYLFTDPAKKSIAFSRIGTSDLTLTLPAEAPDAANSVIVLEVQGKLLADSVRRLDPTITNRLLVFDGKVHGRGFSFGDGKANRYNVEKWTSSDQYFTWDLRSLQPASYKVVLKYLADEATGGVYQVTLDDFEKSGTIVQTKGPVVTQEVGVAKVKAGSNQLSVKAKDIAKGGFVKLLEIQLIPENQ
jgi:alpha-L-fucosidase